MSKSSAQQKSYAQKTRFVGLLCLLITGFGVYFLLSEATLAPSVFGASPGKSHLSEHESMSGIFARDEQNTETKKHTRILDLTEVRVVIGIGVFAFLNALAITVHHIAQKVSRSSNTYREVEHVYSPF
ncbi:hypothetical protein JCM33374_g3119 [Metschnikowia sp. JCM 33374]|nr:hypothetical protein JCM33374_g3119 [Metschnikowia sp. JCM 33374]